MNKRFSLFSLLLIWTSVCLADTDLVVEAQISYLDLSDGKPSATSYESRYYVQPAAALQEYSSYVADRLNSEFSNKDANYHINVRTGYGCDYQACATVAYDHGEFTTVTYITVGDKLPGGSEESPIHASGRGGENYHSSGWGREGPSPGAAARLQSANAALQSAKHDLDRANQDLDGANQRLRGANRDLGFARSSLQSEEREYQKVLRTRNRLAHQAQNVADAAKQIKQRMQNSKTERDRLGAEKTKQQQVMDQATKRLDALVQQVDGLTDRLDTSITSNIRTAQDGAKENRSAVKRQIENGIASHNAAIEELNDRVGISEEDRLATGMLGLPEGGVPKFVAGPDDLTVDMAEPSDVLSDEEFAQKVTNLDDQYVKVVGEIAAEPKHRYADARKNLANSGKQILDHAVDLRANGEREESSIALGVAETFLDLALDFVPVVSTGRDIFEFTTGMNLVTGETLSATDRAMAGFGIVTLGLGSRIFKGIKACRSIARKLGKSIPDGVIGQFKSSLLQVTHSAKKGEWSKVFSDKVRPSELLKNSSFEKKFRADKGIPANWEVKFSKKGEGAVFHEPCNPHTDIRVMPGKPNSNHSNSRKPYVEVKKNGKFQDKNGNSLPNNRNEDAHIPLDDFQFPF